MKVISGCQTGADEGGLKAAHAIGIATGGTMPKGWKTQDGPRPDLAELYGLEESKSEKYPPRTRKNVKDADVTIIFGNEKSPGCRLTIKYCDELNKPHLEIPFHGKINKDNIISTADEVISFLYKYKPKIINIAGNREHTNNGIGKFTELVLLSALVKYNYMLEVFLQSLFEN